MVLEGASLTDKKIYHQRLTEELKKSPVISFEISPNIAYESIIQNSKVKSSLHSVQEQDDEDDIYI